MGWARDAEPLEEVAEEESLAANSSGSDEPSEEEEESCDERVDDCGSRGGPARHASSSKSALDASTIEPIHEAPVIDLDKWREELQRVTPALRQPLEQPAGAASSWKCSVDQVRRLCRQIMESRALSVVPEGPRACGLHWREDLLRIRRCEDRLNDAVEERAAELARTREAQAAQSEGLCDLQESVARNSEQLAALDSELEHTKVELSRRQETLHDDSGERLVRLRDATRRI